MNKRIFILLAILSLCLGALSASVHRWAENSALSEGTWIKVALNMTDDGIYQISYSQLRNWGFSNPSQVGVYGYGGHVLDESFAQPHLDDLPEVAVLHDAQRQRILFYGRGLTEWYYRNDTYRFVQRQNPYATQSYYFLHEKSGEAPLQLQQQAANTPAVPGLILDNYDEHWLHEQESVNIGQTGRQWYGESFLNTQSQNFTLPNQWFYNTHTLQEGSALLTVNFIAKSAASSSCSVRLNGQSIGNLTLSASTDHYTYATEATLNKELNEQTALNTPVVGITYNPGSSTPTIARLNYIRLQGKCPLAVQPNEPFRLFRNAKAIQQSVAYRIQGISSTIQIWDVTSPTDIRRETLLGDSLLVATEKGLREYAIVNVASNDFPTVSRIGKVQNQNLHSIASTELIIITPAGLKNQAERLAEHRWMHDGLSCMVVTPELIYNEYSSGVPDVTAIRLFLKQKYDQESDTKLRYLLMFGDGSYDNRAASRSNMLLPTYQSDASLVETSSFTCDDYFGMLDDNEGGQTDANGFYTLNSDKLDISIGRLPVSNVQEAEEVVDKIIGYDTQQFGSWKNRICFLSDDDKINESGVTDSPNLHMRHNESLCDILAQNGHHEYMLQKIYLPAYKQVSSTSGTDYPDARKDFYNMLQQGALLVNYAGHGAPGLITNEQIMNTALAAEQKNKHLPVWIFASCEVSRWDADLTSMGEALLLNPQGGGAAVIAASRVVYASENLTLNKAIFQALFRHNDDGSRFRLGDILRTAKVALGSNFNKLNYSLVGDPTMTLAYPEQKVVIDSIQGAFKALCDVTIFGHVQQNGSEETDTTFNGLIYPTLLDVADTLTADKGLYQDPIYSFATRNNKLFAGRDKVQNGKFRFSFKMPMDLSDRQGTGLLNLYACSIDGNEGNGYYHNFAIADSIVTEKSDTTGPMLIACYLDNPDFKSGDKVSSTPLFYAKVMDESGINASGSSIGHDICLTLHCLSNPMIATQQIFLNNDFTTLTAQPLCGFVQRRLDKLPEGTYQAIFRVWDVYNNPSTYSFTFTTSNESLPTIALLQAYPSPVKQNQTVTFRALHNRPESADQLRLQIFTQTGVKVLDQTTSSNACEVVYLEPNAESVTQISNALNADESSQLMGSSTFSWTANVAPGIYIYKAYLTAGGDEATTQSKLLIVY